MELGQTQAHLCSLCPNSSRALAKVSKTAALNEGKEGREKAK